MATNNTHFDMWEDDDREWTLGAQVPMSAPPIPQAQHKSQDHWSKGVNSVSPQRLRLEPIHEGRPHSYTQAIQDQDVVQTYDRGDGRYPDVNQEVNEEAFITKAHHIWMQGQFPEFDKTEVRGSLAHTHVHVYAHEVYMYTQLHVHVQVASLASATAFA